MFERLRALYASGRLTDSQVHAAAVRGWITEAQAAEIIG